MHGEKAHSLNHECDLSLVYEALDARRGLCRHGDAHARHRRRQHRALAHRRRTSTPASAGLQWVVDAYTLALASVVLTAGSLADRFGRRRLFTIGLAVFTVASRVRARPRPIIVLLDVARAVQGIGAAVMFAVSLALLANAFPGLKERAGALAAYGATIGASFAIGPLVGGALTTRPRLALDLPDQHPARHRLPVDHPREGRASRAIPRAPRVDRARPRSR